MSKQRLSTALILRTVLVLLFSFPSAIHAFDRDYCEFGTDNYSLEWAFEPNTQKIVFVLKLNSTENEFWTGVGFNGSRSSIDFVGVLVRNGQVVMADAYLNESGVLYTDVVSNVQTIGYDYNGKSLLVKFARPLNSPDMINDQGLDGCVTFLLPREPANKIEATGIRPKIGEFHRFKVCDIKKHCSIDMNAKMVDKKKPTKTSTKPKKPTKEEAVKFAKSVDVSGTGDPCSFAGKDYTVNWTYVKQTDRIQFTMELPAKQKKWWSAVGIGEWMIDMDMGVLFLDDGKVKKLGDYISTSYGSPDEDDHNDWKLESSKKNGDIATVKFSRAVKTDDTKNDRTMEGCVMFQFASNVGKYEDGFLIQKHDEWPDLYKACDLRENCAEISFEKRAKNRKNKQKHDEVPETDENNDDEKKVDATTTEPSTTKQEDSAENVVQTTQNSVSDEESGEKETTKNDVVKLEETTVKNDLKEDELKTTVVSEISEESSGEEAETSTLITVKSTEISLDDSSGQEPKSESSEKNGTELVTGQPEVLTTTEDTVELTTLLTTLEQGLNETVTAVPTTDQTTKSEDLTTSTNSTSLTTSTNSNSVGSTKLDSQQCDPLKQDLAVCQSYMNNYMSQVKEWAARHDETMEAQYGKACALLSGVPHVPTLCCNSYQKICNAQVAN